MFGSNVPKLVKMICDAIDAFRAMKETGEYAGMMVPLSQMVPCEEERFLAKKAIDDVCIAILDNYYFSECVCILPI